MNRLAVLLITTSCFIRFPAHAADDLQLASILRAENVEELRHKLRGETNQRKFRKICSAQLKSDLIPTACFSEGSQGWIKELCIRRAKTSSKWFELERTSRNNFVPEECREAASERLKDLRYTLEAEDPAQLYRRETDTRDRIPDKASEKPMTHNKRDSLRGQRTSGRAGI